MYSWATGKLMNQALYTGPNCHCRAAAANRATMQTAGSLAAVWSLPVCLIPCRAGQGMSGIWYPFTGISVPLTRCRTPSRPGSRMGGLSSAVHSDMSRLAAVPMIVGYRDRAVCSECDRCSTDDVTLNVRGGATLVCRSCVMLLDLET